MTRRALVAFALVLALAPTAQAGKPSPPPLPDPHPSACHAGWCPVVTFVAYDVDVPAIDKATGEVVPGVHFRCHVPVRWRDKPNRYGRSTCRLEPGDP